MAEPITWRSIRGPSLAEASRPLEAAQQSITGAFDKFASMLREREAVNQGVLDRDNEAKVQTFLDRLQGAATPDQVAALKASGELDTLRAALKPADLARVRGAEEARTTALRQGIVAENAFNDQLLARERAPLINKANMFIANNDPAGLKAFLDTVDLGDESKFIIDSRNTQRTRQSEDRADELAPVVHKNQVAAANLTAQLQPQMAKNAVNEAGLKGRELTERGRVLDTAEEDRLVANLTQQTAQAYQNSLQEDKAKLSPIAKQLGIPLDSAGLPDVSKATNVQLKSLDALAQHQGLRTTEQLFRGDTQSANQFLKALSSDTRITPAGLARNRAGILSSFDSSSVGAPVGNDAVALRLQQAQADVVQKERDASNWYAPGTPDANRAYEDLAKEVPALIDKTNGLDADEDAGDIQKFITEMATVGLDMGNGKFLTPSVQDMRGAIRAAEGGWFRDATRAENAKAYLKKNLNTSRVTELLKQAEESKIANRQRAVREILTPAAPVKK